MGATPGLNIAKLKKNVIEYWQADTGNWPVKVVSMARGTAMNAVPGRVVLVKGYVASEKFVAGRTPDYAEKLLGLKPGDLANGAMRMRLNRLPQPHEFELRAYTYLPAGQPYTGGAYPPGLGANQWELLVEIPATVVKIAGPGMPL